MSTKKATFVWQKWNSCDLVSHTYPNHSKSVSSCIRRSLFSNTLNNKGQKNWTQGLAVACFAPLGQTPRWRNLGDKLPCTFIACGLVGPSPYEADACEDGIKDVVGDPVKACCQANEHVCSNCATSVLNGVPKTWRSFGFPDWFSFNLGCSSLKTAVVQFETSTWKKRQSYLLPVVFIVTESL